MKQLRKSSIVLAITLVVVTVFSGCAKKEDLTTAVPPVKQLVIGENMDLVGIDPVKDMSSFVRFLMFDSLVELGYNFEKIPGLATQWNMSEDGKTWTFKLREGVKFHDGEAFNAQAAKDNFQHRKDGGVKGFYQAITTMETPDEYTFVVNLIEPMFTFASDIAMPTYGMISPKAFDSEHNVIAAIGTGPFVLEKWNKDVDFTMLANKEFYDGAPNIERLVFKVIPDSNARAMALESGEIDMMSGRNALTAVESLKGKENTQIIKTVGQTSEIVMINTFNETLADINIRKAIAHSVDFQGAVKSLLADMAEPAVSFFSPVFGDFVNPELALPSYNPELAKEHLKLAGYEDSDGDGFVDKAGNKLTIDLVVDSKNEEDKALAVAMQDQLKNNGIELLITMMDSAAIKDKLSAKDYQLAMQGQNYVPTDDPSVHYKNGYYHSTSFYNMYSTEALDKKIEVLLNSLNQEERLALHKEIQSDIVKEVPVLMMFHRNNIVIANEKLKNFEVAKGTWQIYKGLEKAEME